MDIYRTYRYSLSLTSQFYFCGIPFRLDTSSKCSLNCTYCYSIMRGGRRASKILYSNVSKIKRKFKRVLENGDISDVNAELLAHRVPIHFGGMSEPFSDNFNTKVSIELLLLLKDYNYPVVISTKNPNELVKDEILDLLKGFKQIVVQISLTSPDKKFTNIVEPNVPTSEERIRSMHILSKEGIYSICRLQPLFFFEIDKISQDLVPMLKEARCKHIIVEYLKLPVEKNNLLLNSMLKDISWNAYDFYKKNGAHLVGREWLLPDRFKWRNLKPVISSIHKSKMTYGAGDYGLNHLGDTDCCCGIDGLENYDNWFKGNFSNFIKKSKSKCLRFSEFLKNWFPQKSIRMYINSNCRLSEDSNKVIDYLRMKWNSPGKTNAIDSYLGINWLGDYDKDGNCMYEKDIKEVTKL